jgi:hypothetical protein
MATDALTLNPDDELARRLDDAAGQPLIIEHNGVRYRIEPEDPFAFYDPQKMREAIHAAAGTMKGVNREELLADLRAERGQASIGRPAA